MRITFILPHAGVSGGIRVVAMHALGLHRRGHHVTLISTPWIPWSRLDRMRNAMRHWMQRVTPWIDGLADPSHVNGLPVEHRRLREVRPVVDADVPDGDVVIATWWETAEWVNRLSPQKGARAYFIQGYETDGGSPADRLRATWRLPMHKIVVAGWLADVAANEFGDLDVSIVPNSVDRRQFCAPPRGKQQVPTVGMLYSPAPSKGSDIAIEAYRIAKRKVPRLRLVSFGQERRRDTLLPNEAIYHQSPRQTQLSGIYASCDAWLFSSRREGFGLPILEAMACRTPVIATPAGAAPELLTHGVGMLVNAEDPLEMARAIERIVAMSDSEWQTQSAQALQIASRYSWDDACDAFEQALDRATVKATHTSIPATVGV